MLPIKYSWTDDIIAIINFHFPNSPLSLSVQLITEPMEAVVIISTERLYAKRIGAGRWAIS